MTIDNDAAGLFAQVIPALLVFLALEDRLTPKTIPNAKLRRRLLKWREMAVVMNLAALGLSLAIVITPLEDSWIGTAAATQIAVSVFFLLLILACLFANMFLHEEEQPEPAPDTVS
jgi:hypothetical protein